MTILSPGRLLNRTFGGVVEFISGYFTNDSKTDVYHTNDSKTDYLKYED